ncbi:carboxyl transferase domain-containing protein, partial [Kitasatospora sp. NPDC007106]|uniref:carboxyl transferase domain-containing protein n=1 Tax=Kitasatospora sp. NPDC007106 TaxID=3156914 RepID=UPI0034010E5C
MVLSSIGSAVGPAAGPFTGPAAGTEPRHAVPGAAAAPAPRLESAADPGSAAYRANEAAHRELVDELRSKLATAALGGGAKARARHTARGKLLPRDRVDTLLDPGSPFLELCPLAADGLYDGAAPAAGVIAGIGRVAGREVVVVANDATVKGGTYYPMTVKKHLRAQEVALENR